MSDDFMVCGSRAGPEHGGLELILAPAPAPAVPLWGGCKLLGAGRVGLEAAAAHLSLSISVVSRSRPGPLPCSGLWS